MKKSSIVCDRCGKEDNSITGVLHGTSGKEFVSAYDVCNACWKDFTTWIKTKPRCLTTTTSNVVRVNDKVYTLQCVLEEGHDNQHYFHINNPGPYGTLS